MVISDLLPTTDDDDDAQPAVSYMSREVVSEQPRRAPSKIFSNRARIVGISNTHFCYYDDEKMMN